MRRTEFPTDHDLCTPCPFKGRATESTDLGTLNVAMRVVRGGGSLAIAVVAAAWFTERAFGLKLMPF